MQLQNIVVVLEGAEAEGVVVVEVVVEGFAEEVETVEMVETFDVCGEASAVFGRDLDLVAEETRFCGFVGRDNQ